MMVRSANILDGLVLMDTRLGSYDVLKENFMPPLDGFLQETANGAGVVYKNNG